MIKFFAKIALDRLHKYIDSVTDADLKKLAGAINKKVNVPNLDEDAEGKIIYASLETLLVAVRALLDIAKV